MKHITCIEDLRQLHKRRVPKAFFDYADRGSYTEDTLRANHDDLQQIKFRQRILVDVSKRDLSTTILAEPSTMPLILAPVGLLGMQHGDAQIHACRAAPAPGGLQGKRSAFGNLAGHLKVSDELTSLSTWINSQFDTSLNWKDIDWIRSIWPGKLILKGILDVEDAELAAKTGAQAIVVSNHGGRQLHVAPSSIEGLPEIVTAVGSKREVMF